MSVAELKHDRAAHTYDEVAKLLSVSERTVWQLVKNGQLKAFRIGRSVRISRHELDAFIQRREARRIA
ncbi:MAG: hypothetical protein CMJ78_11870 [Planctomycetaceae bacterium]|nr:hypothetical protein [Planctomycetaceae bacterium]